MDFTTEMNEAINRGLEGFKLFIRDKINENSDYLSQFFWSPPDGLQMTVINFLVSAHHEQDEDAPTNESRNDLTAFIDCVLELSEDKNVGEPLHQAILAGKLQLALHLLGIERGVEEKTSFDVVTLSEPVSTKIKVSKYNMDRRDNEGRTLLAIILNIKNIELLRAILMIKPNVHATTSMTDFRVMFQPIHQAVVMDFAEGVRMLAAQGAQLANPLGPMKDTPLILAARLGKITAMEALLDFPGENLLLEATNNNFLEDTKTGHTALEELCNRIANSKEKVDAIRGVAMLLCQGAEPPVGEEMRELLSRNRIALLKAIDSYLEKKTELVDAFVNRCHVTESPLHNIVYADHSWGSSIRHLFGKPSDAAFLIENMVTRKYNRPYVEHSHGTPLSSATAESLLGEKNYLKLYAEFVRRYTQAYDSQIFTNRWSTMRWMIAEGRCDWVTVVNYARNHPTSRTRIIWGEMFHPMPKLHEDIEDRVDETFEDTRPEGSQRQSAMN
ncbi:hypothetical protein TUM19329_05250 [Legionella antarctica]|uniref:Uncharacterized protein n=1 Tax=Legionella antarctica TaxID=2708020 RepID=A0A6F8T0G1_9GAMM|nr:Dot/Icm T4SS effector AnkC/LegA12 [Legionella antarctica]BCA94164.1 hypothetical protein TUM19329_05250 [Legionella antarctica]